MIHYLFQSKYIHRNGIRDYLVTVGIVGRTVAMVGYSCIWQAKCTEQDMSILALRYPITILDYEDA